MTFNEFKEEITKIPDLQTQGERRSGGILGVYVIFGKWKFEDEWIFIRAYETVKGVMYMLNTIPEDVYLKQDFKVLHVTGNNNVNELLVVESTNDDAT